MAAVGAHRPGPLKQQNKAHKGGKHSGASQRRAGGEAAPGPVPSPVSGPARLDRCLPAGRVSVKAQPRRRLRDLSRVDRRHQALQLRRQRKEAVRAEGEREASRLRSMQIQRGRCGCLCHGGRSREGNKRRVRSTQTSVGFGTMKRSWVRVELWREPVWIREGRRGPEGFTLRLCPQVMAEKRGLGSRDGPPHLVVVVPLHCRAAAQDTLRLLQSQDSALVRMEQGRAGGFALLCPRLKQRWRFVTAQAGEEELLVVWFLAQCPCTAPVTEVFYLQGTFTLS